MEVLDQVITPQSPVARQAVFQPVPGSEGKFVQSIVEHNVVGKDGKGKQITRKMKGFDGHRLLEAMETRMPEFDNARNMYVFIKPDNTYYTQADVQALCDQMQLTYDDNHPKAGKRIKKTNIKDFYDPFITHSRFRTKLESGEVRIDAEDPMMSPVIDMLRGNGDVTYTNNLDAMPGNVRYQITDPVKDSQNDEAEVEKFRTANKLFDAMADDKARMISILRALGNAIENETSIGSVKKAVMVYVKDDKSYEHGMVKQKAFIHYATLPPEELKMKEVIQVGLYKSEIQPRGGIYELNGMNIGSTLEGIENFFKTNPQQYESLKTALGL